MAVTIVTIDGAVNEIEVRNASFFVKLDGQELYPALVTNLEIENSGENSNITVDCGDTERRKTANGAWVMRVEGIVTSSSRTDNLSMERLRDDIANSETVEVRSGLFSGRILVSNVIISAPEEVTEIQTNRTNGREKAWAFSMVLGEESSE